MIQTNYHKHHNLYVQNLMPWCYFYFYGSQEKSDRSDLIFMSSTGHLPAFSFVTDFQIRTLNTLILRWETKRANTVHYSSLTMNPNGYIAHKTNIALDLAHTHDDNQYRLDCLQHKSSPNLTQRVYKGNIPPLNKLPSIKWSPGFEGRCLPGAYISTFLKSGASCPRVKMSACEWKQGNY
jgi:hypothetical protein